MRLKNRFTKKLIVCYVVAILLLLWAKPTTLSLIIGLPLVIIGELIRIWATGHLRKNEDVITSGPYSYIRDPMYCGTLLILNGICLASRTYELLILVWASFAFYYMPYKQKREGQRLSKKFGEVYNKYRAEVWSLIPTFPPYRGADADTAWSGRLVYDNSEIGTAVTVAIAYIVLIAKNAWFAGLVWPAWTLF